MAWLSCEEEQQIYSDADNGIYASYRPFHGDFDALQDKNADVTAWLEIFDTNINYPVVKGRDNNEYLNHDAYGDVNTAGSIFMDYRDIRDDFTTVIYGHNMSHDLMFGSIRKYKDKAWYDTHSEGYLYYDNEYHDLNVVGFLTTDAYDELIYDTAYVSIVQADELIEKLSKQCDYFDFDLTSDRELLFLSTCISDGTDGRHILVCSVAPDGVNSAEYGVKKTDNGDTKTADGVTNTEKSVLFALLLLIIFFAV